MRKDPSQPPAFVRVAVNGEPGFPDDWAEIEVVDRETGRVYRNVLAAEATGEGPGQFGWVQRYVTGRDGRLSVDPATGQVRIETVYADVRLRRRGEP